MAVAGAVDRQRRTISLRFRALKCTSTERVSPGSIVSRDVVVLEEESSERKQHQHRSRVSLDQRPIFRPFLGVYPLVLFFPRFDRHDLSQQHNQKAITQPQHPNLINKLHNNPPPTLLLYAYTESPFKLACVLTVEEETRHKHARHQDRRRCCAHACWRRRPRAQHRWRRRAREEVSVSYPFASTHD